MALQIEPYDMNHKSRGPVLIFNNKEFKTEEFPFPTRMVNDIDASRMADCLKHLGYTDIRPKRDRTTGEMLRDITEVATMNHKEHDSVVIVFLSYGEHNLVYAKNRPIGMQILIEPLKGDNCNKYLIGKPKIIISQTCNPTELRTTNGPSDDGQKENNRTIPAEADFVYLGSEVPGLITDREAKQGSLFISHLSKRLKTDGRNLELRKLATRTLHDVTEEMRKWRAEWAKQNDDRMPYFVSMLTRDLYFSEKKC